jgi:uncharacterized membrane protein YfcA
MAGDLTNVFGGLLLYLTCSLSSAGGIGGGGLLVPIFLVVFGYPYNKAVIFSLCTVFGNYFSQVWINWKKRHPANSRRPLIYWDAVLILLPAQLGGSNAGVLIASVFPEGDLILLAMVVLSFAGYKTFRKGRKYWLDETQRNKGLLTDGLLNGQRGDEGQEGGEEEGDEEQVIVDDEDELLLSGSARLRRSHLEEQLQLNPAFTEDSERYLKVSADAAMPGVRSSSQVALPLEKMVLPWPTLSVLLALWALYAALYTVLAVAVRVCSPAYWAVFATSYVLLFGTVAWGLRHVSSKQMADPDGVLKGDMDLSADGAESNLRLLPVPALAFGIGVLCTLLGIGGGELMGPLLYSLRVLPQVVSATTSTMSFINTSSNLVHYALLGQIKPGEFIIFSAVGAVGGVSGRTFYLYASRKYGRPSITIFMLLVVLFASFWLLVAHLSTANVDFSHFGTSC